MGRDRGVLGHSAGYFDFYFNKGFTCTYTAWNLFIMKG